MQMSELITTYHRRRLLDRRSQQIEDGEAGSL
jgi:hypothetical protein